MRTASALLLAGIFALSAPSPHVTFRYEILTSFRRQTKDMCHICYGDDCTTLDEARCEYYAEVGEILDKTEGKGEVTEIDEMIYDLTDQATDSWSDQKCIPLISYYTDCTKENICVGCKVCSCTLIGIWSCDEVQKCRPELQLDVDHRTLVMVIEKLMESAETNRKKRSAINITDNDNNDISEKPEIKKISLADIAEWMYGVRPNFTNDITSWKNENSTRNLADDAEYLTFLTTTSSKSTEPDYLNFEDVLKNIASDDQTNGRIKSQLQNKETVDYMDLDEIKIVKTNDSVQFLNILNAVEQGNDEFTNVTQTINDAKLVVDLYPRENRTFFDNNVTVSDNMDRQNVYKEDNNTIDYIYNDNFGQDEFHVMKRDISSVKDNNITTVTFSTPPLILETTTATSSDLKSNVLVPLTNIIDDKQNELKELLLVKDNLLQFIRTYNNTSTNITKDYDAINNNNNNTYFSIYKLDIISGIEDFRKITPNILDNLLYKLKRDIYEVLRDIGRIQKHSNTQDLPDNLKYLIHSMKYYMQKQGGIRNFKRNVIKLQEDKYFNTRRNLMKPIDCKSGNCIINQIIDILKVLDKGMPRTDIFAPLSKSSKKIMKRVIKPYLNYDIPVIGQNVYDARYNLSNDLKRIGIGWPNLIAILEKSTPHKKLYAMKLLHFILCVDIKRMVDAIALVNFAYSRRMTLIETPTAEKLIDKIYDGLDLVRTKVEFLIKYHKKNAINNNMAANNNMRASDKNAKKKIKESFLKKIRNLLKHSKKDVLKMAKKNISKSEIVKRISEKKFTELAKKNMHEQTMLRWQKEMNIVRRKRRNLDTQLKNMRNRIKNIIPKYLRGKINPAMAKKRKEKTHLADTKKKEAFHRKNFNSTATNVNTSLVKSNKTTSSDKSVAQRKNSSKKKLLTTPKPIKQTEEIE